MLNPSQVLIDNWKLWMTKEIVVQLKTKNNVKSQLSNLSNVLNFDDLADLENIFGQYKQRVSNFKQSCNSFTDLEIATNILDKIFNNLISKELKPGVNRLKVLSRDRLNEHLSEDLEKASPENLINYLKEVAKLFLVQRNKFNQEKLNLIAQKESASQAYNNLLQIENYQSEEESIWNALTLIYQLQFLIELKQMLSEIMLGLIQLTQKYYNSVNKTLGLLEDVELSVTKDCSLILLSVPIFTSLNLINIYRQQKLIDEWIGAKINYWGNSEISSQQLKAKINNNIDSLARKIFHDFQLEFLKNTIVTSDKLT